MARAMFVFMAAYAGHIEEVQANIHIGGRNWWVFPKQQTEWDVIQGAVWKMSPALLDEKWMENYRMSYSTYEELVEELTPYIKQQDSRWRKAINAHKAVAMVLFRLATGYALKHVGRFYGVGGSTVIKYTNLIVDALSSADKLRNRYIYIPSTIQLKKIIAQFKNGTGLDNIAGAIDGTHIKLFRKLANHQVPADYWCRHDIHSILLQESATMTRSSGVFAPVNPGAATTPPTSEALQSRSN
jgi:hypothetical protein